MTLGARGDAEGDATTLTAEAHRRIEEMIVTLELEPGVVVSEAILSKRLGIGTTPIREALQRLSREHLVRVLPRRGVRVTAIDVGQQLQILETRRELDGLIARMAAKRGTAGQHRGLSDLAKRMQLAIDNADVREFLRVDGEASALMAQASCNEIAAGTAATLRAVSRRFWFVHHGQFTDWRETALLHMALAGAVGAGSAQAAATASDDLIDHLEGFARSILRGD